MFLKIDGDYINVYCIERITFAEKITDDSVFVLHLVSGSTKLVGINDVHKLSPFLPGFESKEIQWMLKGKHYNPETQWFDKTWLEKGVV